MDLEKFRALGLSEETLAELHKKGFEEPTEIQEKVIPILLGEKNDIVGQAQTGTGKTAAFGLPILEKLEPDAGRIQAIVLVPTRELAIQVAEEISSFRGNRKCHIIPIYGGQSIVDQLQRLKKGADIIVGTPGRVLDHLRRKSIVLDRVSWVVLDEADEMLNMGFIDEVKEILDKTNPDRHTLLFSATMPDRIMDMARSYMRKYRVVAVKKGQLTVDLTDQIYFEVAPNDRLESLCRIIDIEKEFYGLIFCRTKVAVDELANKLIDRGYEAEGIHGDLSQNQRERILEKFRKRHVAILVATDVAARGIDVADLTHVINFSLPQDAEAYIHRIGRTGRAGKKGVAITFTTPDEYRKLMYIARVTKKEIRKEKVPRASEIVTAKKTRILAELNEIIEAREHRDYLTTAMQMVHEHDPAEVVAALLKYTLEDELSEGRYRDIREYAEESVEEKGRARLFISLGKKDGLTPRKLLKLINNETRIPAGKVSEIKVMDSYSFLSVPFKEAEVLLKAFKEKKGSHKAIVKRADVEKKKKKDKFKGKKKK